MDYRNGHSLRTQWPEISLECEKAKTNISKHDGVSFEQAATVFFDPSFQLVDASRHDEARDAVVGYDNVGRLLFVVHIEYEGDAMVIISACKATAEERKDYDS